MNEMTKQPKGMSLTLDVGLRRRPSQYRFMPVLSKSKEVKFDHCIFFTFHSGEIFQFKHRFNGLLNVIRSIV